MAGGGQRSLAMSVLRKDATINEPLGDVVLNTCLFEGG